MASRPPEELLIIALAALVFGVSLVGLLGAAVALLLVALGLTAYSALSIRKNLALGAYRRQALGMAFVAIALAYLVVDFSIAINILFLQNFSFYYFVFFVPLTIFYWVDASILAVRRSDPLFRDSLHWSRVRIVLWALVAIPSLVNVIIFGTLTQLFPSLLEIIASATGLSGSGPPTTLLAWLLLIILLIGPVVISGAAGPLLLPVIVRRTKDITLRRHLKWFAAFATVFALQYLLIFVSSPFLNLGGFAAYCLYRSVTSLVPIYKFSDESQGS